MGELAIVLEVVGEGVLVVDVHVLDDALFGCCVLGGVWHCHCLRGWFEVGGRIEVFAKNN
jgi:hypothetical protein